MARSGVTREQVFETADALVREGQNPTVVAVRTRLGGGSPNTITPLLAEWKTLNETKQAAGESEVVHVDGERSAMQRQPLIGLWRHGVEQELQRRFGLFAVGATILLVGRTAAIIDDAEHH